MNNIKDEQFKNYLKGLGIRIFTERKEYNKFMKNNDNFLTLHSTLGINKYSIKDRFRIINKDEIENLGLIDITSTIVNTETNKEMENNNKEYRCNHIEFLKKYNVITLWKE